jgi:putative flippase GtrA
VISRRSALLMAGQLARFGTVGLICLVVSTAALAALHDLAGLYYLVAFGIAFCIGNILGYVLNGRFTFTVRATRLGASRYLLLNGTLLAVNSLLMKALVDGAHVWYIGASLLLALFNTPLSFLLHRTFSYSVPSMRRQQDATTP